ncbi:hypothetical protein [Janthinobacterium sp. LB2P10]|uniref:hypothetical protein n=1 Tax=Janthinobacterium sp. LB2P10 TaxID=3424194 RepID=UPI003F27C115
MRHGFAKSILSNDTTDSSMSYSEELDSFDDFWELVSSPSSAKESTRAMVVLLQDSLHVGSDPHCKLGGGVLRKDDSYDSFGIEHYYANIRHSIKSSGSTNRYTFNYCLSKTDVKSTLLQVYAQSSSGEDAKALKALYFSIESSFAKGDLNFVDDLLKEFDPTRVRRMTAVGVLRSTFRIRTQLKAWQNCLAKVAFSLEIKGQSSSHLLRGLYNNNGRPLLAKRNSV